MDDDGDEGDDFKESEDSMHSNANTYGHNNEDPLFEHVYHENGDEDDYKAVKGATNEDGYQSQRKFIIVELADDDNIIDQMMYRDEDNHKQHNITLITTESQYKNNTVNMTVVM